MSAKKSLVPGWAMLTLLALGCDALVPGDYYAPTITLRGECTLFPPTDSPLQVAVIWAFRSGQRVLGPATAAQSYPSPTTFITFALPLFDSLAPPASDAYPSADSPDAEFAFGYLALLGDADKNGKFTLKPSDSTQPGSLEVEPPDSLLGIALHELVLYVKKEPDSDFLQQEKTNPTPLLLNYDAATRGYHLAQGVCPPSAPSPGSPAAIHAVIVDSTPPIDLASPEGTFLAEGPPGCVNITPQN